MAEDKKPAKKVKKAIKKATKLKITKSNGKVIYRDIYEGLADSYKAKGFTVEEV